MKYKDKLFSDRDRPIVPKKYYIPYSETPPSRFSRKKNFRGSTAPKSNKNFRKFPKSF